MPDFLDAASFFDGSADAVLDGGFSVVGTAASASMASGEFGSTSAGFGGSDLFFLDFFLVGAIASAGASSEAGSDAGGEGSDEGDRP